MSAISSVNDTLLQSQLSNLQVRQAIDVKVAKNALDATEMQADAALKLLDAAATMAKEAGASRSAAPSFGSIVSGLGQNLDVCG